MIKVSGEISDTFEARLKNSRICVIGAGYGNDGGAPDSRRWGNVDPYYIGITGMPELMGNIPGNPIGEFNWNDNITWVGQVFIKYFRDKSFDTLYIDRGTLRAHMTTNTVNNLFRLLSIWINRNLFSIDNVMIPKWDITSVTKVPDHILTDEIIDRNYEPWILEHKKKEKRTWESLITKHAMYSKLINDWLERVSDEVIIVADVEFIQHQFKKI